MALKFDMRLIGCAVELTVKSQSHPLALNINLSTLRLDEIWKSELHVYFFVVKLYPVLLIYQAEQTLRFIPLPIDSAS